LVTDGEPHLKKKGKSFEDKSKNHSWVTQEHPEPTEAEASVSLSCHRPISITTTLSVKPLFERLLIGTMA